MGEIVDGLVELGAQLVLHLVDVGVHLAPVFLPRCELRCFFRLSERHDKVRGRIV